MYQAFSFTLPLKWMIQYELLAAPGREHCILLMKFVVLLFFVYYPCQGMSDLASSRSYYIFKSTPAENKALGRHKFYSFLSLLCREKKGATKMLLSSIYEKYQLRFETTQAIQK